MKTKFRQIFFPDFVKLLYEFRSVFATSLADLKEPSNLIPARIITIPNHKPVRMRPYRLNDRMRAELDKQLDQLLQSGIIEEDIDSAYVSPVVMIKKPDNSFRFCVDLRRINEISVNLYHELPSMADIIDLMSRNKMQVMTTFDFKAAYFQQKYEPSSYPYTCFGTTYRGNYHFTRVVMGHKQSSHWLGLGLSQLLRHELGTFCLVYVDDVILVSESHDVHLDHLRTIFTRFKEANLKLNPIKCNFMLQQLKYLGHIFDRNGVSVDPDKTKIIREFPAPKNQKQLRRFLGMVGFHRRAIHHYADRAYALTKLLKQDVAFQWTDDQEKSFQDLKSALQKPPVLALPQTNADKILCTDASDKAISFSLYQKEPDGTEKPICFGARGLRTAERNYPASQLECLAVIAGIQAYEEFLVCRPFTIRTDCIALKYLSSMRHARGRLGRWALQLSQYNYTVQHTKGAHNSTADALSRLELPPSTDNDPDQHFEDEIMQVEKTPILWEISIVPLDENNTAQLQPVVSDDECTAEPQQTFAADRTSTAKFAATSDNMHAAKQPVSSTAAAANARPHEQRPTEVAVLAVSVQAKTQQGEQPDSETDSPISIGTNIQPLQGSTAESIQTDGTTQTDQTQENTLQLAQTYDIARLQSECNDFKFIMDYLSTGNLPQTNDAAARKIIFEAERYVLLEGVLHHIQLPRSRRQADLQLSTYQLAVPTILRHIVLSHYHEGICHPGAEKMYLTIRTKFYWPGLFTDAYEWAKPARFVRQEKIPYT